MIALKRVLVPTDFSECSDAAVKYATALARAFGAELHLLHVPEHPGEMAEAEYPIGLFETMQNAAHDRLSKLLSPEDQRAITSQFAMRIGSPYAEIMRYAQQRDIDLIVMGTHGRGFVAHMVMGSVAEKVVRKAPCPVLTVRHPQHDFVLADERPAESGARLG
jgi:nucleotide-binding universal stress UspA family protein